LSYDGDIQAYNDIVEYACTSHLIESEDMLDAARDMLGLARARERLNHDRWVLARRMPKKFSEKYEIKSDSRIQVFINRDQATPVMISTTCTTIPSCQEDDVVAKDEK